MSCPSNRTRPATRAPGTVSCMRFRQRSRVDLPHPDGPMIAVTKRSGRASVASLTACRAPKYASRDSAASRGAGAASGVARATPAAGAGGVTARDTASAPVTAPGPRRSRSGRPDGSSPPVSRLVAARSGKPMSGRKARDQADEKDEANEDEGAGPGLGVPVVVRADRIGENLQRECGDRLVQRRRPELVSKGGEEEGRGLTGDPGNRDQRSGDDPRARRPEDDRERCPPSGVAERQRRLTQRDRYR